MDMATFRRYTDWHDHANRRRYEAPADPWRLVTVDPAAVEYYTTGVSLLGLGRVTGGDWDRADRRRIRETSTYEGLVQRFAEGRDWEETALYRSARERFEDGETVRGYESIEAFREVRCSYLDDLYERIHEEGYRPNAEAGHDPAADNRWESAYANRMEPMVVIGRDGEVQWAEGYHRFSIASILGLDAIPVYVLCRHVEWQRVRDAVAAGESPPELDDHRGHPDLADLTAGAG